MHILHRSKDKTLFGRYICIRGKKKILLLRNRTPLKLISKRNFGRKMDKGKESLHGQ